VWGCGVIDRIWRPKKRAFIEFCAKKDVCNTKEYDDMGGFIKAQLSFELELCDATNEQSLLYKRG